MDIILEQRHIGSGALIGPDSVLPDTLALTVGLGVAELETVELDRKSAERGYKEYCH